jgi:hypothetical protein
MRATMGKCHYPVTDDFQARANIAVFQKWCTGTLLIHKPIPEGLFRAFTIIT